MPAKQTKLEQIIDWILSQQDDIESDITNMKLQKLLFYLDGCYSAVYDKALFQNKFQAWEHGPVIPSVYHKYKHLKSSPIAKPAGGVPRPDFLSDAELDTLKEALALFGKFSPWTLRQLSHEERPWSLAFNDKYDNEISKSGTKEWFKQKYLVNGK